MVGEGLIDRETAVTRVEPDSLEQLHRPRIADRVKGSASLAVGTISNAVDEAPVGEVIAQDPLSGTEVPPGSSIDLVVSAGSTP